MYTMYLYQPTEGKYNKYTDFSLRFIEQLVRGQLRIGDEQTAADRKQQ